MLFACGTEFAGIVLGIVFGLGVLEKQISTGQDLCFTMHAKAKVDVSLAGRVSDMENCLKNLNEFLLALRAFVAESELLVDPADDADAEQAMNTIVQKAKQMKEAAETHADHMKAFIKRSKALF